MKSLVRMGKRSQQRMTELTHEQRVNLAEKVSGQRGRARCWRDLRYLCHRTGIFFHRNVAVKCKRRSGICAEVRRKEKKEEK